MIVVVAMTVIKGETVVVVVAIQVGGQEFCQYDHQNHTFDRY